MSREDIIRIAREAGLPLAWISEKGVIQWEQLERFAALISTAKVVKYQDILDLQQRTYEREIEIEVEAEREACARVCEDIEEAYRRQESIRHPALRTDAETGSGECADAIRARSNT